MRNIEFEVKIGLFVFIGLIILTIITFSIGDFFFRPGYHINVIVGFANGVEESAPVRLAGIEVGEVKKASVFKDETGKTKVRLKLWLTNDAKVEKDATVCVNTLGLIGEKYVEILPGTPNSTLLANNDTIEGTDSVSVEQITKKGYEIALKVEKVVDSIEKVTNSVDLILNEVRSGKGTIGKLFFEDELYNNINDMVKDLKTHPWKLLSKPHEAKEKALNKSERGNKGRF